MAIRDAVVRSCDNEKESSRRLVQGKKDPFGVESQWPCQCVPQHKMQISCSVEQMVALFSARSPNALETPVPPTIPRFIKTRKNRWRVHIKSDLKSKNTTSTRLPPCIIGVVHHVRVVPTLALTSKQSLADSGIALRLVLHPCLQDARVHKID